MTARTEVHQPGDIPQSPTYSRRVAHAIVQITDNLRDKKIFNISASATQSDSPKARKEFEVILECDVDDGRFFHFESVMPDVIERLTVFDNALKKANLTRSTSVIDEIFEKVVAVEAQQVERVLDSAINP